MAWPLSQDYNEAIQSPESSFNDPELKQGEAKTNAIGLPMPRSGNFADVYEFNCPATNRKWAIKCFTREVPGLRDRYSAISAYLKQINLPFMVDFEYLDPGIKVRGQWFPVLKMHWVEGFTLNEFVKKNADQPASLDLLGQIWVRLSSGLREARIAHGDLEHGNVLLVPGSTAKSVAIKLIDYDSMCVPVLAQKKSGEIGHPAYQHPQRLREGIYSVEVDRFPHLVIYTALRSLMAGSRQLWDRYYNGDNLLFRQEDLMDPAHSALFQELRRFNDPGVQRLVEALSQAAQAPFEHTPWLDELVGAKDAIMSAATRQAHAATEPVRVMTVPQAGFKSITAGDRRRIKSSMSRWAVGLLVVTGVLAVGGVWFAFPQRARETKNDIASASATNLATPQDGPAISAKNSTPKPAVPPGPRPVPQAVPDPDPPVAVRPVPALVNRAAHTLRVHKGWIGTAFYTPNGSHIIGGGEDHTLKIWDAQTGQLTATLHGHSNQIQHVAISLDGKRLVSASADKTVMVWNMQTRQAEYTFVGHTGMVKSVAISPDGKRIVSASVDKSVRVWDARTGQELLSLHGYTGVVTSVAISPDGRRIVGGGDDRILRIWDAQTGQVIHTLPGHTGVIKELAFRPDGEQIVSGCYDKTAKVWDVQTGRLERTLRGHKGGVMCVVFSPDGQRIASGSTDQTVMVWATQTGQLERTLQGHTGWVLNVAFSPDGKRILSASLDETLKRWDLPSFDIVRP